jgi:hypothetical protein
MSEGVLFHHIQGLTEGVRFADQDLVAARVLVESTEDAKLYLCPGDEHLFADLDR